MLEAGKFQTPLPFSKEALLPCTGSHGASRFQGPPKTQQAMSVLTCFFPPAEWELSCWLPGWLPWVSEMTWSVCVWDHYSREPATHHPKARGPQDPSAARVHGTAAGPVSHACVLVPGVFNKFMAAGQGAYSRDLAQPVGNCMEYPHPTSSGVLGFESHLWPRHIPGGSR